MDNKVTRLIIQSFAIVLFIAIFTPHSSFSSQDDVRSITIVGSGIIDGFSPDGKILASHGKRIISLWSVDNGELTTTIEGYLVDIVSIAFSPDSKSLYSVTKDASVKRWSVEDRQLIDIYEENNREVIAVTSSPDNKMLAIGYKERIKGREGYLPRRLAIWDLEEDRLTRVIDEYIDTLGDMVFSKDGGLLVTGKGKFQLWDVSKGSLLSTLKEPPHRYSLSQHAFSPDLKALAYNSFEISSTAGVYKKGLKIWGFDVSEVVVTLEEQLTENIGIGSFALAFSPYGKTLAAQSGDDISLWDIDKGKLITTIQLNGYKKIFDEKGRQINAVKLIKKKVLFAFSPDGKTLAVGDWVYSSVGTQANIQLWNVEDGNKISTLGVSPVPVTSIVFSQDGMKLAVDSNIITKLWDLEHIYNKDALRTYGLIDKQDINALQEYYNKIKNTKLQTVQRVANDIVDLAKSRSSINDYQWLIRNITDQAIAETAYNNLYAIIERKNTVKDYQWFIAEYPNHPHAESAIKGIYDVVSKKNNIKEFQWFITNYKDRPLTEKAINDIYGIVTNKNTIKDYQLFLKHHPNHASSQNAIKGIYTIVQNKHTFNDYKWFIEHYQQHQLAEEALKSAYKLVNNENNILGYAWFAENFSRYPISKTALRDLHLHAFKMTEDKNTIEAWNDFIIAYPYAKQINEALKNSYALEAEKYTGWFSSDEKNSRALWVKMKQLEMKMEDTSDTALHPGYLLILHRMSQLLQEKFPAEEATLNYIESDNYAALRRHYKSTLEEIRQTTKRIAADKGDIAPLIAEQGKTIHTYFSTTAQSDAMAKQYMQLQEQWEQYLDKHELRSFKKVY